jgi:hypothetical protein
MKSSARDIFPDWDSDPVPPKYEGIAALDDKVEGIKEGELCK